MNSLKLRLESLFILALVYIFSLGKREVQDPKTIVVANFTTNLGDMTCSTPIFSALKKNYPGARLIVVGTKKNKELLEGNPHVDRYIVYINFWNALSQVKKEKPDWGIAVNPSPHETGLLLLSGAKPVAAFSIPEATGAAYSALNRFLSLVPYTKGHYVPGEYLKLLVPFGINEMDTKKTLSVSKQVLHTVETQIKNAAVESSKLVVFAPSSGQEYKEWPTDRFARLALHASQRGASIGLVGAPGDEEIAKVFISQLSVPVFNGVGQSIEDLKATLSLAKMVVGNDSGTIYIGEAFGAATLVVAGVTDQKEHPLQDGMHGVVTPKHQEIKLQSIVSDTVSVDRQKARAQVDSILVEEVQKEFDRIWGSIF